jgi:hypothetical protein
MVAPMKGAAIHLGTVFKTRNRWYVAHNFIGTDRIGERGYRVVTGIPVAHARGLKLLGWKPTFQDGRALVVYDDDEYPTREAP